MVGALVSIRGLAGRPGSGGLALRGPASASGAEPSAALDPAARRPAGGNRVRVTCRRRRPDGLASLGALAARRYRAARDDWLCPAAPPTLAVRA